MTACVACEGTGRNSRGGSCLQCNSTGDRASPSRGGSPWTFSASQVSTYEVCPRKWAFRYVDKIATEPNRWAQFGLRVHEIIAHHYGKTMLDFGTRTQDLDAQECANALIARLPQKSPDMLVEHNLKLELEGHRFTMYIDLLHAPKAAHWVAVHDHKTTSDLCWSKSADDLVDDVQATLYAAGGFFSFGAKEVILNWTYVTTRGKPQVAPVQKRVTLEMIAPRLEKTIQSCNEMQLIMQSGLMAKDVVYDPDGCSMFGGCPYIERCNLTPEETLGAVMSQGAQKESFMDRLRARQSAQQGGAPATAQAPQPDVINAPEAVTQPPAAPAQPAAEAPAPPKRRPGRPRATEPKPPQVGGAAAEQGVKPPEPTQAPVARELESGFTLYVDCMPTKGATVIENAAERIERVMKAFTAETGKAHYKLVPYGEGAGLFQSAMARDLLERPPASDIYISTKSVVALDALHAFYAAATVVVQG